MVRYEISDFTMESGDYKGLKCHAPASAYSVLVKHGLAEDPRTGADALLSSLATKGCSFTSEFDVSALAMSKKNVQLRFSGLDTLCRIEINGKELARTDNMHRVYIFDIKTLVDVGKNTLTLHFEPTPDADPSLRKAYAAFGNGGAPYLPDMGIFRGIELIAFDHKIISGVKVKQTHTDGSVRLDIRLDTVGHDEMSRAVATLTSPAGNVYFCGFMNGEGSITVSDPNLWWPHGMGVQSLYRLNINLYSESEIEDTYEMRIGLRRISISEDEITGVKQLLVNGCPMFPMGAEYMLQDIIVSDESEEKTEALLRAAKDANFNTVFVHGSGVYPEKCFFELCDELGLAVWQQIPLQDFDGEDRAEFSDEIKREISENISAVSNYPSLCVITGNQRLSRILGTEDEVNKLHNTFSAYDGMNVFDVGGELPALIKRISYPSIPSYRSVCKFTDPSKRNIGSDVFEHHGADSETVMSMLADAYENYPYANGMKELSYVLGLASAESSRSAANSARANKDSILGISVGTLNESWPSVSSAGVDYYGERRPLHYYEHRFLAPVTIMAQMRGTRVKFLISNISRTDYHGVFAYSIMDNRNRPIFRDSFPILCRASTNMELHNVDISSVIKGHENEYYLLYSVTDKTMEASRGILLFTKTKRFAFLKPEFTTELAGRGTEFLLTISSSCFAKGVEISFDEIPVSLSNNYFDITSKAPIRIRLTSPVIITVEKLKRLMKIHSVYDLGHEG